MYSGCVSESGYSSVRKFFLIFLICFYQTNYFCLGCMSLLSYMLGDGPAGFDSFTKTVGDLASVESCGSPTVEI